MSDEQVVELLQSCTMKPEDIKILERFHAASPFMKRFDINFVRIVNSKDLLGGDFLLCVGGWRMGKIPKKTDELFKVL